MSTEYLAEGRLANGFEYGIAGRALNGDVKRIGHVVMVGQDAVAIVPEHNAIVLFDGSGGATDVGSAEEAAFTAANAAQSHIREEPNTPLADVMSTARSAVIANHAAGLCIGAIARLSTETNQRAVKIEAIHAGNIALPLYDAYNKQTKLLMKQQMNDYSLDPLNHLGRTPKRIKPPIADEHHSMYLPDPLHHGLFLLTDGAFGFWQTNQCLENSDFAIAHDWGSWLQDAIDTIPNLEEKLRSLIPETPQPVAWYEDVDPSPERLDSSLFAIDSFGWDTWEGVVKPYLEKLSIPRKPVGALAVARALLDRRICWDFEKIPPDDAIVAHVQLQS